MVQSFSSDKNKKQRKQKTSAALLCCLLTPTLTLFYLLSFAHFKTGEKVRTHTLWQPIREANDPILKWLFCVLLVCLVLFSLKSCRS